MTQAPDERLSANSSRTRRRWLVAYGNLVLVLLFGAVWLRPGIDGWIVLLVGAVCLSAALLLSLRCAGADLRVRDPEEHSER
jgi:hypothetical protein